MVSNNDHNKTTKTIWIQNLYNFCLKYPKTAQQYWLFLTLADPLFVNRPRWDFVHVTQGFPLTFFFNRPPDESTKILVSLARMYLHTKFKKKPQKNPTKT